MRLIRSKSPLTRHSLTSGISRPEKDDMKAEGNRMSGSTIPHISPYEARAVLHELPDFLRPRGMSMWESDERRERAQLATVTGRVILSSLGVIFLVASFSIWVETRCFLLSMQNKTKLISMDNISHTVIPSTRDRQAYSSP